MAPVGRVSGDRPTPSGRSPSKGGPGNTPQVEKPANELDGLPKIRISYFEEVPYVQVLGDSGKAVVDHSCTEATILGLLLIAEAGNGLNRQLAREAPAVRPDKGAWVSGPMLDNTDRWPDQDGHH